MALKLTIVGESGAVSLVEVSPTAKISTLALQIHAELSIAPSEQDLRFNGTPLVPSATVAQSGLSDGDLIMVGRKRPAVASSPRASARSMPGLTPSDAALMASLRANQDFMDRLRATNPQMHRALLEGDPNVLRAIREMARNAQQGVLGGRPAAAGAGNRQGGNRQAIDPMSAGAQTAIEERIRMENVMRNMEAAMEHNPESFGSVVMLFVDCKVNSVDGVKAFVDSGAQATIISKQCAERCNILRLLDSRFAGMAHGVGSAKIHGRIHLALLTLGTEVFEVSFTVMDAVGGSYDMLLGLDMLRKHQACIDLRNNCLRIGSSNVPFLPEKDIPKQMLAAGRELQQEAQSLSSPSRTASASGSERSSATASARASAPTTSSRRNAASTTGRSRSNEAISRLVELGFSRPEAEEALRACNGNADQAAAMLTASKYGF